LQRSPQKTGERFLMQVLHFLFCYPVSMKHGERINSCLQASENDELTNKKHNTPGLFR